MNSVSFNIVEVITFSEDDKPVIELYGKTSEGEQICVRVRDFRPYFWARDFSEIKDEKIIKVENHKKKLLGEEIDVRKVYVQNPYDVKNLREKFDYLEADIPFTRRFLIDRRIKPLFRYRAEGTYVQAEGYKVKIFEAEKLSFESEELPDLKVLSVDIETHAKINESVVKGKDPIIMIAMYGKDFKKVLTWKPFNKNLSYVECLDSELEMLKRFKELLEEFRPDVLTGYFSDGFDLPCLKKRAEENRFDLNLGLNNSKIKVSKTRFNFAEVPGISHIDMFSFVKRIFKMRFRSFKLDDIAKSLLGEEKVDLDLGLLYEAWENQSPKLEEFAEYNLQDAKLAYNLCIKLMPNIVELTKMIGQSPSEVTRMSFSQLVEWYFINSVQEFNELAPNRPDTREERHRYSVRYVGASVLEPKPGLYKDISVFDFRSLYPTIISAHNISPDVLVLGEPSKDGVLEGFRFSQEKRGFISTVVDRVIQKRLEIKKLSKEDPGNVLLDARQHALKTIANSIYGYYGFFGARWYSLECAQAITAYGRHHVKEVISKAEKAGLKILYSDTDSFFILSNGKTLKDVMNFAEGVNKNLPGIMGLDYEGTYVSGIFVHTKDTESGAKKRYALMGKNGDIVIKGFESVRRNVSRISKETQEKVLRMILEEKNPSEVIDYVKNVVKKLREKKVETSELIISTQITKELKNYSNITPHVAAARKMSEGGKVPAGTVVHYVVGAGEGLIRDRVMLPAEIKKGSYDAEYYVRHQIIPAIERLLELIGCDTDRIVDSEIQKKIGSFFN